MAKPNKYEQYPVHDAILTVPNIISFIRLCMIPVCLWFLLQGENVIAFVLFALTAGTDWVDGQIARRTNQVSRLGQLLDPAVDCFLLIGTVLALLVVGRLPLWMVLVVIIRDAILLIAGAWLKAVRNQRVPVIFWGKLATTLLYIGMAFLIINLPILPGLGLCDAVWLPLFNSEPYSLGFWFLYVGLIMSVSVAIYYIVCGVRLLVSQD